MKPVKSNPQPGHFFLVVGPSGAGKDSLMDGAKSRLSPAQFAFAKRTVTRPPGMVGEDYESCDPQTFARLKAQQQFLATWAAHDYEYGLPITLAHEQSKGKHIVANGSRAAVAAISQKVPNLVVIHVTAPIELLAKRLAKRGRETETEIAERLTRHPDTFPADITVKTVVNDASLREGVDRFVATLLASTGESSDPNTGL